MSDYKEGYEPDDKEYPEPEPKVWLPGYGQWYYKPENKIPALEAPPPGQDRVPGGVLGKCTPSGSLESLKEELEWLRARVERLEQKGNHND